MDNKSLITIIVILGISLIGAYYYKTEVVGQPQQWQQWDQRPTQESWQQWDRQEPPQTPPEEQPEERRLLDRFYRQRVGGITMAGFFVPGR
jgi:hypothetical protein